MLLLFAAEDGEEDGEEPEPVGTGDDGDEEEAFEEGTEDVARERERERERGKGKGERRKAKWEEKGKTGERWSVKREPQCEVTV